MQYLILSGHFATHLVGMPLLLASYLQRGGVIFMSVSPLQTTCWTRLLQVGGVSATYRDYKINEIFRKYFECKFSKAFQVSFIRILMAIETSPIDFIYFSTKNINYKQNCPPFRNFCSKILFNANNF